MLCNFKHITAVIALLLIAITAACPQVAAQDNENEFERIATRVMQQHEDPNFMPDTAGVSGKWNGGAYMGVTSNGRTLPSANFRFKNRKIVVTGDVSMELAEVGTGKTDNTLSEKTTPQSTETDIHTSRQNADASVRLDYYPSMANCFTVGLLENYNHSRTNEEAVTYHLDADEDYTGTTLQQQDKNTSKFKLGGLLQWKHLFADQALLTARLNLRRQHEDINLTNNSWDLTNTHQARDAREETRNFTPYGMLSYESASWNGFSFRVQEKFTLEDMDIEDRVGKWDYSSANNNSALALNYKINKVKLTADGSYDYYRNTIDDVTRKYNDWLLKTAMTWAPGKACDFSFTFKRSIKRPTYTQLYDKKHLGSSLGTYYIGNRSLEPALTRQYEAKVNLKPSDKVNMTITAMYEDIDRGITKVSGYDEIEGNSYITWINDATYDNFHLGMDGKWVVGPMDLRWHVKAKHTNYEGQHVNVDASWSWYFKLRPEFALPHGWKVAGALYYTGREKHLTYVDAAYTYVSVRAVKEIGQWTLYGFIQDILEHDRKETVYSTSSMVVTYENRNSRCAILGASYTF